MLVLSLLSELLPVNPTKIWYAIVYCTTFSQSRLRALTGWLADTIPVFAWRARGKPQKAPVRTASVKAEIRKERVLNTSPEWYRYTNLLSQNFAELPPFLSSHPFTCRIYIQGHYEYLRNTWINIINNEDRPHSHSQWIFQCGYAK
jgi:hypothetical protein